MLLKMLTEEVPNEVESENTKDPGDDALDVSSTRFAPVDLMDAFVSKPISDLKVDNGSQPHGPLSQEVRVEKETPAIALPNKSISDGEVEEQKISASLLLEEEKSAVERSGPMRECFCPCTWIR